MSLIKFVRFCNALFIIVLCGIVTAAYTVQFYMHEIPCPLCLLQRLGMIGIACCLLLNLRFGIKAYHYGLAILTSLFGGAVSARQISLHICPGFPTFGTPIWGLGLYTWAFLAFFCSLFSLSLFLILYKPEQRKSLKMNGFERFAGGFILLISIGNVLTTLHECGLTACPR